jgi:hypothetical protein
MHYRPTSHRRPRPGGTAGHPHRNTKTAVAITARFLTHPDISDRCLLIMARIERPEEGAQHLTPAEGDFLDRYSGTTANPAALEVARAETARKLAETRIPDVPHIEAVRAAMPAHAAGYEAVHVSAFVENARIDYPDTDGNTLSVRAWLESGRDPAPVIALARTLHAT